MTEVKMGRKEILGEHCDNPEQERKNGFLLKSLDEDFTVSSCEGRIQGQFEDWVQKNVIQLIDKHKNTQFGERLRRDFAKDYSAGKYFWPDNWSIYNSGEHIRTALDDAPGTVELLYLMLKRCHKDMTREKAARIFRDNPDGVTLAMNWAMGNPNSSAPNQEANGAVKGNEKEKEPEEKEPETLDGD